MADKSLAVNVTVGLQTYEAGTTPPKDVAEQITNPKAWGNPPQPEAPKAPAKKAASSKTEK